MSTKALFASLLGLLTLTGPSGAMDSTLEALPAVVDHDLDMPYGFDVHTFTLDGPSVVRVEIAGRGFDPRVAVGRHEGGDFVATGSSAGVEGEVVAVTAVLDDGGEYTLVVGSGEVWAPQATYRMAVRAIPLLDLGSPVTDRREPVEVGEGIAVPTRRVVRSAIPVHLGGDDLVEGPPAGGLLVVDGTRRILREVPGGETVRLEPGQSVWVDGELASSAVRSGRVDGRMTTRRLEGALGTGSLSPRLDLGVGREHPVSVPEGARLEVRAQSPSIYLDLLVLDGAGAVLAEASEGDEGHVALSLDDEAHRAARILVRSQHGDGGPYQLVVSGRRREVVEPADGGPVELRGEGMPFAGSGSLHRVELREPGRVVASIPAGGRILAADEYGRWLGFSSRAGDLGEDDVEVADREVLSVALDEPATVFLLVFGDDEGLEVRRELDLLDLATEEEVSADDRLTTLAADQAMETELLEAEEGELVELVLGADRSFAAARVVVRDPYGEVVASRPASGFATGPIGLSLVPAMSGLYRVDVVAASRAEAGAYELEVSRGTADLHTRDLEVARIESVTLAEPIGGRFARGDLELPAAGPVLLRWECPGAWLVVRDGETVVADAFPDLDDPDRVAVLLPAERPGRLRYEGGCAGDVAEGRLVAVPVDDRLLEPRLDPAPLAAELDLAPDFAFEGPAGEQRLADLRGRVVVLEFWASWCGPCRGSLPQVEGIHRGYPEDEVLVLGVNDEDAETAAAAAEELGLSFFTVADPDAEIAALFAVDAIPRTVVIDAEGRVRADLRGERDPGLLRRVVAEAVSAG